MAVEEVAETLRRLFLKPGADHYHSFVELLGSGKLALELEKETKSSYVFRLFRLEEGGLKELGIELWISKVVSGAAAVYHNLRPAGYAGFRSEEGAPFGVVNSIPAELRLVYVEEEAPNSLGTSTTFTTTDTSPSAALQKPRPTAQPSQAEPTQKTSETRYTPPKPHSHPQPPPPAPPTTRRTRPPAPDGRPPAKRQEPPPSRPEATQCYASSPQPLAAPARRPPAPRP